MEDGAVVSHFGCSGQGIRRTPSGATIFASPRDCPLESEPCCVLGRSGFHPTLRRRGATTMSRTQEPSGKQSFANTFGRVATRTAGWMGSPAAFGAAIASVLVWGVTGPRYHYSNTWQLVINTATTIVTFLM